MVMEMWVVYNRPAEFPESVVARKWYGDGGAPIPLDVAIIAPRLETVRALLPSGLVRFARDEEDDPVIVETWL